MRQIANSAVPSDSNVSSLTNLNCFNTGDSGETGGSGGSGNTGGTSGIGAGQSWYCNGYANVPVNSSGIATGITVPAAGTNNVTIASPVSGATFTGSKAIVKGAVDTTVAVNSVLIKVTTQTNTDGTSYLGQVNGKYYAAEVQLAPGANTITAKVTYQNGVQKETSITVNGGTQQEMAKLTASPNVGTPTLKQNGLTTLDVAFVATPWQIQNPVVSYAWDFNGDGTVDLTCSSLSSVRASYTQPGLYLPTVTITDSQGNSYTATVIVNVLDKVQMENLFKVIWNRVKNALANNDVEGALTDFAEDSKNRYKASFELLINYLPSIAQEMRDITMIKVDESMSEHGMREVEDGVEYDYYVEFVKDKDGAWKLNFY